MNMENFQTLQSGFSVDWEPSFGCGKWGGGGKGLRCKNKIPTWRLLTSKVNVQNLSKDETSLYGNVPGPASAEHREYTNSSEICAAGLRAPAGISRAVLVRVP